MSDSILINGFTYSWSSVMFEANGDIYTGIKAISFADKIEEGKGYGLGRSFGPVSRTAGQYSCEDGKVTMRLDSWQAFSVALGQLSLIGSFGAAEFHGSVQWVEPALGAVTRELERCRVIGVSSSAEQNTDEATVELTISMMRIRYDGLTLFAELPTF